MSNNEYHVIFGTGPVGMAVMDELCHQANTRIRMVNRSGHTSEPLPEGVELISGDAADPVFATEAAAGADVIYFALNPPYHKWRELFPSLQAGVLAAAEATGARLVVMENVYMYGDTDGTPLHEGLPMNAHTRKGRVRAEMHQTVMDAHHAGRVQVVVARAADFFGPRVRESAMGELVFEKAVMGKPAQFIGDLAMPHTQTYMPNIGRALVMLANEPTAFGQVWHVPNAPAISQGAFIEQAFKAVGTPFKVQVLPSWSLPLLGLFNPTLREFPEMMYEFEKPFIVESQKFERQFGWQATPLDIAIQETAAWYRAQAH